MIAASRATGSSPLTRGKRLCGAVLGAKARLIPAHAGKTTPYPARPRPGRAHPRSRGENGPRRYPATGREGSSPLTRGKLIFMGGVLTSCGLIPAHAGKTVVTVPRQAGKRAHPRSRGENQLSEACVIVAMGSSPLTRGKHFLTCAFIAQIDQILESLELCAFSESYSSQDVYATDAPRDRVRSIGLAPRSSRGAS